MFEVRLSFLSELQELKNSNRPGEEGVFVFELAQLRRLLAMTLGFLIIANLSLFHVT